MSPAAACCLRRWRRRPIRSTSRALWRPFSVCRGRRRRNFFSQGLGELRTADAYAFAGLDLGAQARNGPVGPVGDGLGRQRQGHPERRLALHRRGAGGDRRLQRLNAAFHEIAAPQPDGVFPHAERLSDPPARPTRHRQHNGAGSIRLAAIP